MTSLSIQRDKAVIAAENLILLTRAQIEFEHGAIKSGMEYFRQVCKAPYKEEHGVYKCIWEKRGSPSGNSEYGRFCFHGIEGLSSTAKEKADAIRTFVLRERIFFAAIHYPHLKTVEDRAIGDQALGKKALEPTEADYIRDYKGMPRVVPITLSMDCAGIAEVAAPLVLGVAQGVCVVRRMSSASTVSPTAKILGGLPDHIRVGGGRVPHLPSASITSGPESALDRARAAMKGDSSKVVGLPRIVGASTHIDPPDYERGGPEYERVGSDYVAPQPRKKYQDAKDHFDNALDKGGDAIIDLAIAAGCGEALMFEEFVTYGAQGLGEALESGWEQARAITSAIIDFFKE